MADNYINELCRLCLFKNNNLVDIFVANGRHGYLAAEVIKDLLQIEVGLSDGFPRCVCSVCLDKLTDFKLFKDQCIELRAAFVQEFHSQIEAAKRQRNVFRLNQDPLVCSSSIKVEEKGEAEIVEIPVESDEDVFEKEVLTSPLQSEVSELDVVTVDDEDNVLCLGSKYELEVPPRDSMSRGKQPSPDQLSRRDLRQSSSSRDLMGRFLKNEASKGSGHTTLGKKKSSRSQASSHGSGGKSTEDNSTAMECLTLRALLTSSHSPSEERVAEKVTRRAESAESLGHPLWLDSDEEIETQGSGGQTDDCGTQHRSLKRRRQSSSPRGASWADKAVMGLLADSTDGSRAGSEKRIRSVRKERSNSVTHEKAPNPPQEVCDADAQERQSDFTGAVLKMQCGVVEDGRQHPLFDGDGNERSEAKWKHHRRAASSAPVYTESSILLSSGNTPQGFVDVGCLGSEIKLKKRRRKRASLPGKVAKASVQGGAGQEKSKVYKCVSCGLMFKSWPTYKEHRRVEHSLPKGTARCPECNRSFSSFQSMKRHELLHTGLRPFACNLCDNGYTRLDHLKRHMEAQHKQLR